MVLPNAAAGSEEELLAQALSARKRSYCPYSRFAVGAALRAASGKVYTGANVENASYGLSMCAERVALFRAVAEGEREFAKLVIVGGPLGQEPEGLCPPCGACRQVLFEFAPDLEVLLGTSRGIPKRLKLGELLPEPFRMGWGDHSRR